MFYHQHADSAADTAESAYQPLEDETPQKQHDPYGLAQLHRAAVQLEAAVLQRQQQRGGKRFLVLACTASGSSECQHGQPGHGRGWGHHAAVPRLLPPAGGEYPPSCGALVSAHQLPRMEEWTPAWSACVRGLRTLDLLLLHRQWLQWGARKLPRMQALRGLPEGEAVRCEVEDLYQRYTVFTAHVMQLAPEAWHESVKYDLDTLQLIEQTPDEVARHAAVVWARSFSDAVRMVQRINADYQRRACALWEEQARLRLRRRFLRAQAAARALASPLVCSSDEAAAAGGDTSAASDAAARREEQRCNEALLLQIAENLRQQDAQLRECVSAVFATLPAEAVLQCKVRLYPSAANGQLVTQTLQLLATGELL